MKRSSLLLFLAVVFWGTPSFAQSEAHIDLLATAPADRSIDASESEFEIEATTDDTSATIKISRLIGGDSSVQFSASAPLAKSGATNIVSATGFPNAFTASAKYTGYYASGRRTPDAATLTPLCREISAGAMRKGLSESDANAVNCEVATADEYLSAPRALLFYSLFWDPSKPEYMWGGKITAGHSVFEYLDASTAEEKSTTRTPWGFSGYAAVIPPNTLMLITGGFEYRDKSKDADSATLCPPATGTETQKCKTGALGGPVDEQQKIVFGEVRRNFGKVAASLKVGYDFEKDNFSADLPLYLVRSASGALSGGVRAAWEDGKDVQFGVFVSNSFSLTP